MDPQSFNVIEPRLAHLAQELKRLLSLVQLEKDGRPVQVNGFRLRNLGQWQNDYTGSAWDALISISGQCNSRCEFCFEQGLPFGRELSLMSREEAKTRLKYYMPDTGKCLFPSQRPHLETFVNPEALTILEMARQRDPAGLFCITTNGSFLDEETVGRLASLKPLILKLSLNAANPTLHQGLMHLGKRTQMALQAPQLLQDHRIPFIGSLVAWPTLPLEALEETVEYLESFRAYGIRLRLPLVHQWVQAATEFDFSSHWEYIAQWAQDLRGRCRVPLIVEPPIYSTAPIIPEIDGIIINSPAQRAGILSGDVMQSINGKSIYSRGESETLLSQHHLAAQPVDLMVNRRGEPLHFRLEAPGSSDDSYPYDATLGHRGERYGILHVADFSLQYIAKIFDIIEGYKATCIALFSSILVAPIFETLVNKIPDFAGKLQGINLYLETIPDNSLGGNFGLADSRLVEDYRRILRRRQGQGISFDLILIPDVFGSRWGVDLVGESYSKLAMEFGIPVELIDWYAIYGREV